MSGSKNNSRMHENIWYILGYYLKNGKSIFFYRSIIVIFETVQLFFTVNIAKWIFNFVSLNQINRAILYVALFGGISLTGSLFSNYYRYMKDSVIHVNIQTALYMNLLEKIKQIDYKNFETKKFYDEYVRALMDIDNQPERVINTIFQLVTAVLQVFTLITVIIYINPIYIVFGVGATVFGACLLFKINSYSYQQFIGNTTYERKMNYIKRLTYQLEFLKDMKTFSSFCKFVGGKYCGFVEEYKNIIIKYSSKKKKIASIIAISNTSFVTILPWIVIIFSLSRNTITIGEATVIISGMVVFPGKLQNLFQYFNELKLQSLHIENVRKFFSYSSEIEQIDGNIKRDNIKDLSLQKVEFSYNEHAHVLRNINISLHQGEKIAIVGANGEGKTTLVKLLQHLYDVNNGSIIVDGLNIKNYNTASLREHIVAMEQNYRIYGFSIAENILMREVKSQEDKEIVINALKKVGMYDRITTYKQGIDTCITKEFDEEGGYFSGGELQKLALARLYATEADVIIMDEPTSAFDPMSEGDIFNKMLTLFDDKIVILISHKLALVKNVDCIYVLKEHEICEKGNHEQLMKEQGVYYEMYTRQAVRYGN